MNKKEDLIFTLDNINKKILNEKNLEIMDLKKLLLITYNELIKEQIDPLIKSFLVTTLFHFVELEEDFQQNFRAFDEEYLIDKFISNRNIRIFNKERE